jgi:hypothetical protein
MPLINIVLFAKAGTGLEYQPWLFAAKTARFVFALSPNQ